MDCAAIELTYAGLGAVTCTECETDLCNSGCTVTDGGDWDDVNVAWKGE